MFWRLPVISVRRVFDSFDNCRCFGACRPVGSLPRRLQALTYDKLF